MKRFEEVLEDARVALYFGAYGVLILNTILIQIADQLLEKKLNCVRTK